MESDRRMDVLVAKHIMGLSPVFYKGPQPCYSGWCAGKPDVRQHCGQFYHEEIMNPLVGYSSDLVSSFKVVDKLIKEKCRVEFLLQGNMNIVTVSRKVSGPEDVAEAEADILFEAICSAALKLYGVSLV